MHLRPCFWPKIHLRQRYLRFFSSVVSNRRNVAVIAHVDHGKTTLVDCLLKQSLIRISGEHDERVMDHNPLERERGITILAKCTSVNYDPKDGKHPVTRINIVDTPGHSDFGGEVERILSMVDGVALVVDATEGPMTQTKFVLGKALKRGLKPFVVINKVDRPTARIGEVENEIFDLFATLDATDEQAEYPTLYASGVQGWAVKDFEKDEKKDMTPIFEMIMSYVPPPKADISKPFSMLVTNIEMNPFFGKCLLGRIQSGKIKVNDPIVALDSEGKTQQLGKVSKIFFRNGLEQLTLEEAFAGDIVTIAGVPQGTVNSTLCDPSARVVIPSVPVDPPTLSMIFSVNDSPLSGKEGNKLTSSVLRERLLKEGESNVSLQIRDQGESLEVCGRGELQLGILIETMRREGFELSFSAPQVVYKEEKGKTLEPMEELVIDVPNVYATQVTSKLFNRRGDMIESHQTKDRTRLIFHIPTRGLIGYRSEFTNDTHGEGVMNQRFLSYVPYLGEIERHSKGSIIATESGKATAYAIESIEARGKLFISPGDEVYEGMVVGEHNKEGDLTVNPTRSKKLTNVRAASKDDNIRLTPPTKMSLEDLITYVRDDEVVEVTPTSTRLRKKELSGADRTQAQRKTKKIGK